MHLRENMPEFEKFQFSRSRGIVWVCDIANSSKYLNNNESADELEEFLQRFYWTSAIIVEAAGGKFIKWTGDGFIAWLEIPLHRELGTRINTFFKAAWHLTFLVNVTQLGLKPSKNFKIRHGITYEQDALLTTITYPDGHKTLDITGRAVVLAFRLSGIQSDFPNITTQRELVQASRAEGSFATDFKKWLPSDEDKLRYFKGNSWGLNSIYISGSFIKRTRSLSAIIKNTRKVIKKAESFQHDSQKDIDFSANFLALMNAGPYWCKDVTNELLRFAKEEMLDTLKTILSALNGHRNDKI